MQTGTTLEPQLGRLQDHRILHPPNQGFFRESTGYYRLLSAIKSYEEL